MSKAIMILLAAAALGLTGCNETTAPRDITPPAAPRGLFSVTGDTEVTLRWLANTESDVSGYRIYQSPCASGPDCPYDRIGTTSATQFVVTGLTNGVTRFYAVAAVDRAGNESPLSYEDIFDTPRPEGSTTLANFTVSPATAGWDFSAFATRPYDHAETDIFYGYNGSVHQMFAKDLDLGGGQILYTDIQDMGFASSLDAIDWAPNDGWSPSGTVELIQGHCYVVWTRDDHYAKFRVTSVFPNYVAIDWAYQTDQGNPELRARPVRTGSSEPRPIAWLRQ